MVNLGEVLRHQTAPEAVDACSVNHVPRPFLGLLGFLSIATSGFAQSVTLSLGSASGTPGSSVVLPITLASAGGAQTAAIQWTFAYSSDIASVTVALGASASTAGKSVSCNGNTCVVWGLNSTVIPDGAVAIATFQIAANPSSSIPIQVTGPVAANPDGSGIPATGASGVISIPPVQAVLTSLICSPASLSSNTASTCTVSLNQAAPAGAIVSISSNNAVVTVPATVTISAGQTSTTFQASAGAVTSDQTAAIKASWNGINQSFTLTLAIAVPSVVSATPAAGSGASQIFTFVFADSQSAANLSSAAVLFATSVAYPNACLVIYEKSQGSIQLQWDSAAGANAKLVSSPTILKNSQCSVGATTVVSSGLTTTITIAITFQSAFAGLKNIYMYAADAGGTPNTGWVQAGAYTVNTATAPVPSVISVTPTAASGTTQTFVFVFGDSVSAGNISGAAILFGASLAFPNSCMAVYDKNGGTIQLEWDGATGAAEKPIASALVLKNSQCNIGATSAVSAGLTVTLTMSVTFSGAFNGLQNIYMYAAETGGTPNTGWVQEGTYTVTTPTVAVPSVVSVTPNAGSGASQTFSFVFGDSQSPSNLSGAAILIGSSLAFPNSCMVIYDQTEGTVQLEWDSASGSAGKPVGSPVILQNSQCAIGATSVVASGLTTTITVAITFENAFTGLKNIYLFGVDDGGTANTGWVQAGTFTIPSLTPTPSAISATPNAGSGASQNFSFVFADSLNATNLTGAVMLFDSSLQSDTNSCMVIFDRTEGTLQLAWDSLLGSDSKPVGSATVLQNSQCAIGANAVVTSSLTTTISIGVTFNPLFSGLKDIALFGVDNGGTATTGWVLEGTWTPF